ncbi:hypothetical protein FRB94_009961 [Tulasnella sp. JGI-2019a]|nr:hypothetical protein FRB94_009961 [Tulasnella sp. JGI-2019a]
MYLRSTSSASLQSILSTDRSTPDPEATSKPLIAAMTSSPNSSRTTAITSERHNKYYDEHFTFLVENKLYCVSTALLRQSKFFAPMLDCKVDTEPELLSNVTDFEMESLLDVLDARQTASPLELSVQRWGAAVRLAIKLQFHTVREYAISRMESQFIYSDAVSRIELAIECDIPQWLHPAYNFLCMRDAPITAEEGRRLGHERSAAIWRIRELYRAAPHGEYCGQCGLCLGLYTYGDEDDGFPSCENPPGYSAMNWIRTAKGLEIPGDWAEEAIIGHVHDDGPQLPAVEGVSVM